MSIIIKLGYCYFIMKSEALIILKGNKKTRVVYDDSEHIAIGYEMLQHNSHEEYLMKSQRGARKQKVFSLEKLKNYDSLETKSLRID